MEKSRLAPTFVASNATPLGKILRNIPLPVLLLLLIAAVGLRLPSFLSGSMLESEAMMLLYGDRLASGAVLYTDVWYGGPPMLVWFYGVFCWLFGENALLAIRIFTVIYVFITAVYFNALLLDFRLFRNLRYLPAILLLVLTSVPVQTQEMSAWLLVLLPLLHICFMLVGLSDEYQISYGPYFRAGLWMALCSMADYTVLSLLLGFLVLYFRLHSPKLGVFFSLFGGVFIGFASVGVYCYFRHSLGALWDQGMLYYIDKQFVPGLLSFEMLTPALLRTTLWRWGVPLLLAVVGVVHYRLRFFSYLRSIRNAETGMALWLLFGLIGLLLTWSRLSFQDLLLLAPPVAFYATKALDLDGFKRFRIPIVLLLCVLVVPHILQSPRPARPNVEVLRATLSTNPAPQPIWILGDSPLLYRALNAYCPNKYLDFRIATQKLPCFAPPNRNLKSRLEPEAVFFREFVSDKPRYILDTGQYFTLLRTRYPTLFEQYTGTQVGNFVVYKRQGA